MKHATAFACLALLFCAASASWDSLDSVQLSSELDVVNEDIIPRLLQQVLGDSAAPGAYGAATPTAAAAEQATPETQATPPEVPATTTATPAAVPETPVDTTTTTPAAAVATPVDTTTTTPAAAVATPVDTTTTSPTALSATPVDTTTATTPANTQETPVGTTTTMATPAETPVNAATAATTPTSEIPVVQATRPTVVDTTTAAPAAATAADTTPAAESIPAAEPTTTTTTITTTTVTSADTSTCPAGTNRADYSSGTMFCVLPAEGATEGEVYIASGTGRAMPSGNKCFAAACAASRSSSSMGRKMLRWLHATESAQAQQRAQFLPFLLGIARAIQPVQMSSASTLAYSKCFYVCEAQA